MIHKNVKSIFFVLALFTLLLAVSTVSATDDANVATDTSIDVVSQPTDAISDNNIADTKNMEKTTKEIKKDSITIDGKEYDNVYENQEIENEIDESSFFNNCTFNNYVEIYADVYINDSTINNVFYIECEKLIINNTNINANEYDDQFYGQASYVISNSTVNAQFFISQIDDTSLIENTTLNNTIYLESGTKTTIADDVIFGEKFSLYGDGEVIIDDINRILPYLSTYDGNYTLENMVILSERVNYGNLTFKNSTLDSTIYNYGNLTITDNCFIGGNFVLEGEGVVITNKTEVLAGTIESIEGDVTFQNAHFKKLLSINGNVTLNNCTIDSSYMQWGMYFYDLINNTGNLTLINCNLLCGFNNTGNLTLYNSTIPKGMFYNYGKLTIDNVCWDIAGSYSVTGSWNNLFIYNDTIIKNSTLSSRTKDILIQTYTDNLTIIDCQFLNFTGTFHGKLDLSGVTVMNTVMTNNSRSVGIFRNMNNINLINSTFEGNYLVLMETNNTFINNCTFINNTYVVDNQVEHVNVNDSLFINHTKNPIINVFSSCNIANSTFENNSIVSTNPLTLYNGIAINLYPYGNATMIITDNTFKNNYLDTPEGTKMGGYYPIDATRTGFGTDIALGLDYRSNNQTGDNNTLIISNNNFINSQTTQKAGAIFINFNETCDNNSLTISDNHFENVKSKSETIIHNNTQNVDIKDNTFINCTIDMDEFMLSSPQDDMTISLGTPITLNIESILSNPQYYDQDLLSKSGYQIFINDENKYNTTENEFTFTPESFGTYTINVINPATNNKTNEITVTVVKKELLIDEINAQVGDKINITTQIRVNDEAYTQVNGGKVVFKVNGKTLKDANGKVIYVKVAGGKATLENYIVPESWMKEGTVIEATFSGSKDFEQIKSEKTPITINKEEIKFTTKNITATAGSTINLTATITEGNKVINSGKVVFKINGKTVKDSNGKTIYVKVENNQASLLYTLPDTYKAKKYTLTATFISNEYERMEDTKTLNII
jgi:hypothetical protein